MVYLLFVLCLNWDTHHQCLKYQVIANVVPQETQNPYDCQAQIDRLVSRPGWDQIIVGAACRPAKANETE